MASTKIETDATKNETDENQKSPPGIDKKLYDIKVSFDKEYKKWWFRKHSESSSKHGNLSTDGGSSSTSKIMGRKEGSKANRVETRPEVPNHTIRGFTEESLFLGNFLLKQKESKDFKTLAIVGKYGVGKTTLCQDVFNNEYVREAYFPRIWVSMFSNETIKGEDPSIDVLRRILRSLGVENDMLKNIKTEAEEEKRSNVEEGKRDEETVKDKELSQLLNNLHLNLIGKKYLILLDDVWEEDEWDQRLNDEKNRQEKTHLSHGFPKGFGGRVIVTSRDEGLAKKIVGEEENVMRLYPRTDVEKIFEIYKDKARVALGEDVDPRYPSRFNKELMDKSFGIPLAARMLAEIRPMKMDDDEKLSNLFTI